MKNFYPIIALFAFSSASYAQVGINTNTPNSSLDIAAKNATGTSANIDGLLLPRVDRQRAQSMTAIPTSTMIYVNNAVTGTQTGNAVNIDAVGYYYYNGLAWVKLENPSGTVFTNLNIYNGDGTLQGNRIVTQGANTLAFTASAVNAFSVDATTFSVDATNKRIGVGTIAPKQQIHITETGSTTGIANSFISGLAVTGTGSAAGFSGPGFYLENTSAAAGSKLFKMNYSLNATEPILNFQAVSDNASTSVLQMLTLTRSGKLGINATVSPASNLTVNGNAAVGNSYIGIAAPTNGAIVQGNVGVGNSAPTNALHVTAAANPLRLEGTGAGVTTTDKLMVLDATGVVKTIGTLSALSIPNPAIFRLATAQADFLNGVAAGGSSVVPMAVVKNTIPGMTYNTTTNTITFPAGTYQMTFVYEATHGATGCNISSYFVDFPLNGSTQRVHSTAAHGEGNLSNHGGTITYATTVPANATWQIALGRGQSGNCSGLGMSLAAVSTQVLVYRIGD
ncbi:hypothetical protein [Chryseobacterium polytrichastri]|uniref:C1q domain-containing protein n=1 Tax=Chryseobacterium polytrichastri TaxID=1302687 RepID=A0A1M6TF86_9FLAO|nr:hypothetical protein [Chryseobacterium polytrichastri]SHK55534.1 hypothetical protein SAMN05444267_100575 [Chryseobacterium polytrichastri]